MLEGFKNYIRTRVELREIRMALADLDDRSERLQRMVLVEGHPVTKVENQLIHKQMLEYRELKKREAYLLGEEAFE